MSGYSDKMYCTECGDEREDVNEDDVCPDCEAEQRIDNDEMLKDAADDRKLQEWKDGDRPINGRYRGER